MAKIYYDNDADLNVLKGKKIAVIGYGIQGRGQSLNLRESGLEVIVSELPGTKNFEQAKADGFNPVSAAEASKAADVVQILTEDHVQAKVYKDEIVANMKKGKTLIFSHGFNIRFKQIKPSKKIDVIMIAPKGPGALVRKMYEEGKGVPCLVAIYQDASGNALKTALAYAKGIGGTKAGVIETTFEEETETDLFGEQAVLCGGVSELITAGFDTLVDAGYQPEIAYFETLHELKLITDLVQEGGIEHMWKCVSNTAEYGGRTRGKKIITEESRKNMQEVLDDIKSGKFAEEFINERKNGLKNLQAMREKSSAHQIENVGKELRKMFERK